MPKKITELFTTNSKQLSLRFPCENSESTNHNNVIHFQSVLKSLSNYQEHRTKDRIIQEILDQSDNLKW
jgi:hypothetical protein